MLNTLKFVQGAIARRDFVPEMQHFIIKDNTVRAFNGVLALSSPIDFALSCAPKAAPLVRAIANCTDVISLGLTETDRLRIESGPFRTFIECVDMGTIPDQIPEGDFVQIDGDQLLEAVRTLTPFIGDDAARPWTNGILFHGCSAFATNNVCLIEYWLGFELPFTANVPINAIREIERIGEPPIGIQLSTHSITFHYSDQRWIRSLLFSTDWPDVTKILAAPCDLAPLPEGLFDGLAVLKGFADKDQYVYFTQDGIRTVDTDNDGTHYAVPGIHPKGIYRLPMLMLLKDVATLIDFELYPKPVMFQGDRVRGAIIGRTA